MLGTFINRDLKFIFASCVDSISVFKRKRLYQGDPFAPCNHRDQLEPVLREAISGLLYQMARNVNRAGNGGLAKLGHNEEHSPPRQNLEEL